MFFLRTFANSNRTAGRSAAGSRAHGAEGERKVRATQGIPLPNRKRLARVCRCRRKQPPCHSGVRVRRWGKSPPGQWRHWCCTSRELKVHVNRRPKERAARPSRRVERWRPAVTQVLDKWQTPLHCGAYRTRLTGPLSFFSQTTQDCPPRHRTL